MLRLNHRSGLNAIAPGFNYVCIHNILAVFNDIVASDTSIIIWFKVKNTCVYKRFYLDDC